MANRKPPAAGKGKKPGTLNGTTKTLREVVTLFVEHNAEGAQVLYNRVARTNPAKALAIFSHMCEFVLPRLARTEVTLPPETVSMLGGPIIDAASATAAYLQFIGDPNADLSELRFEPVAVPPIEDPPLSSVEPVCEPQPIEEPPMHHPQAAPALEPDVSVSDANVIDMWSRLGK